MKHLSKLKSLAAVFTLAALVQISCSGSDSGDDEKAESLCKSKAGCDDADGGTFGSGNKSDAGSISQGGMVEDSDSGVLDNGNEPPICANVDVQARRVTPTVMLIVDQSGSMTEPFDMGMTRWNVLRSFLLASDGLIADLQSQVRFGLSMYSARSIADGTAIDGECPLVSGVAPKLDNLEDIATAYNAQEPIKETPTGDSIDKIVADLMLDDAPDVEQDPIAFILATDGEPDRCEDPNPTNMTNADIARQEAIGAVTGAFGKRIRTFVISVGTGTVSATHLQDLANAGIGKQASDPEAEYWVAGNDATLRMALQDIIGSQLSCDIKLDGKVSAEHACDGTVELGGKALKCNDKNGWKLIDENHIRIQGSACTTLKTEKSASLHVSFPCDVPIVF